MKQLQLQCLCCDWVRQTVLLLYTMDASLCHCTSLVIYINGLQLGEGVRKENLVMDGLLPTHMVQGERNWYALWWWGDVGRVKSGIVFPFICIYMQNGVSAHYEYIRYVSDSYFLCFLSFQVLILYSGWSRIWTLKIKVKELLDIDISWVRAF